MRSSWRVLSGELPAHPFELAAHVVDDVAALQVLRQHVPGVGLDLKLARQGLRLVEAECVLDGEARGAERAEVVEKNRHVEVGTPFARSRRLLPGRESIFKVQEAGEAAVLLLYGLGEIDGLRIAPERIDGLLRDLRHVQGGRL